MCGSDLQDGLSQEFWAWEDKEKEKEDCCSFVVEIEMRTRVKTRVNEEEKEKKTSLPLSGSGERMDHLKGFWSLDRNEPRDKNDQRDETFPKNPNHGDWNFLEKHSIFLKLQTTPC